MKTASVLTCVSLQEQRFNKTKKKKIFVFISLWVIMVEPEASV